MADTPFQSPSAGHPCFLIFVTRGSCSCANRIRRFWDPIRHHRVGEGKVPPLSEGRQSLRDRLRLLFRFLVDFVPDSSPHPLGEVLSDLMGSTEPMDVYELAAKYMVQPASIRRDLQRLDELGLVKMVRVGHRNAYLYNDRTNFT